MKGNFRENYPTTAGKFDTSHSGYERWRAACSDHGWQVDFDFYPLADDLTMFACSWYQRTSIWSSFSFNRMFYRFLLEYNRMARKTSNNLPPKRAKWQGFVDYRLSEDELTELDGWSPEPAELWESVAALMNENYRITLSYNVNTKTATATITDDSPNRKAGGWALASSDADCALALKAAIYKHFHVLQGSWENLLDSPATAGRRG